jgi:hypothetical protein
VSFKYPAHYKKVPSKITGSTLEVVSYHSTDSSAKQINVAVYPGNLSGDSSINFRRQNKGVYIESDSQKWIEFTKKDSTEDTFFIENDGKIVTVAFTSPYSDQSGDGIYVASSLKWLK